MATRAPISRALSALRAQIGPRPSFQTPASFRCQKTLSRTSSKRAFSASCTVQVKKYTREHEWVEMSEDGTTGTIGISTYAAKALGDVVYVELPKPSTTVSAGDAIGAVESVKSASDIMSPVSGEIVEANDKLEETPALINKSPEADGWIARVKLEDGAKAEIEDLMEAEEYAKFTDE